MNLFDVTTPPERITPRTLVLRCALALESGFGHGVVDDALRDCLIEQATGLTYEMPDPAGHWLTAADMFDEPCSAAIRYIGGNNFDGAERIIKEQLDLAGKINAFIELNAEAEAELQEVA